MHEIIDVLSLARMGDDTPEVAPLRLAEIGRHAWTTTETVEATLVMDIDEGVRVLA